MERRPNGFPLQPLNITGRRTNNPVESRKKKLGGCFYSTWERVVFEILRMGNKMRAL